MVEVMVVVCIIGVLLNIAIPSMVSARRRTEGRACASNLRRIQFAKEAYMLDHSKPLTVAESEFTDARLYGANGYVLKKPVCPNGGSYFPGKGYEDPRCDYAGGAAHFINE